MTEPMDEYIRTNRGTYTDEAIREQLLAAGNDQAQVDAALVESVRAPADARPESASKPGPHYWRWALGMQAITLIAVTVLVARPGPRPSAWLVFPVLGIVLLVRMFITGNIGRALLPHTGLVVALLLPLISAVLLGGWCLKLMGTV